MENRSVAQSNARGMPAAPSDSAWASLAAATSEAAAELLKIGGHISERKHLQPEARNAIARIEGWTVQTTESTSGTTFWCHGPGGLDLVARDPDGRRWIGELKLRETDQLLWDLLKLVDSARQEDVAGAFLIAGARCDEADSKGRCREIVAGELVDHPTLELFEENREAWTWLLEGGTARPTKIPRRITALRRGVGEINLDEHESELVLISVEADWSETEDFDEGWWFGDWPVGIEPSEGYQLWRRRHCTFLRELDTSGGLSEEEAKALAKPHKLSLKRDTALTHRCSRLVTATAPRRPTDAGRAFLEGYEGPQASRDGAS